MSYLGRGADFAEFGTAPVALDLYLDAYEGPAWAVKPFRNRSGWLTISEAQFHMSFTTWRRTLVVCLTDQGEVLSNAATEAVFDIPTSLPNEASECEPEEFEAHMDDLEVAFLREVKANNLNFLTDLSERIEARIAAYEVRCRKIEVGIADATRLLRAERRRSDLSSAEIHGIDARLSRLSEMTDTLGQGMRDRIRAMRAQGEDVEAEVMSAFSRPASLTHKCTARWRAVSRWGGAALALPIPKAAGWREDNFGSRMWYGPLGWGRRPYACEMG